MSNQLANESSPYLLQHKDNPVDWHPWCSEALERAKTEDKPIFLSIGYSACHWCHVMEHESFENEQIAASLNERFVCIKVDREERPDLDQIYMGAVQMMTGHGGWPMSVFLTPDLQPFYGGTYWPPQASRGMPGFDQVINAVNDAWVNRRQQLLDQSADLTKQLSQMSQIESSDETIDEQMLYSAAASLERNFDFTHGGFGRAPKFPHAMDLTLLLRIWCRMRRDGVLDMVRLNLDKMAQGGIYDHLGGGFARYSVDERWLVPHFEKMLYDNALLAGIYLDAFRVTRNDSYAKVVRETCEYVLRDMTDEQGGFFSSEDADSEGEEGKYYVWTPDEIKQVLGEERAERFCYAYDVADGGNFEGKSILNLPKTIEQCCALRGWNEEEIEVELSKSRDELLAVRDQRVRPGRDDKVLVSWNALMIDAMARAGGVFNESKYLNAAVRATEFILSQMRRPDGRLLHTWCLGQAKLDAYLDDYAYLTNALVTLYESSFDEEWINEAVRLADIILDQFADPHGDGFFFTANDHEQLLVRTKDMQDSSVPSGNSMVATALFRLGKLTGREDYLAASERTVQAAIGLIQQSPTATGQMLTAVDMMQGPFYEIVIIGDQQSVETKRVLAEIRERYQPNCVVACRADGESGVSSHLDVLFQGKSPSGPRPAVYICQQFTCQTPAHGQDAAMDRIAELSSAK